tara:strand:+ start:2050 stop:2277 length:228 start_codon:yes stop_codon:yes gene_type:complete
MSNFILELRGLAGSEVLSCAKEAVEIANRLGVCIEYNFNGVTCLVTKHTDPEKLVENWKEAINKPETKYKKIVSG